MPGYLPSEFSPSEEDAPVRGAGPSKKGQSTSPPLVRASDPNKKDDSSSSPLRRRVAGYLPSEFSPSEGDAPVRGAGLN